jgi:hypothetical protein
MVQQLNLYIRDFSDIKPFIEKILININPNYYLINTELKISKLFLLNIFLVKLKMI